MDQLDVLLSKLSPQEKQFIYVLLRFPDKARWEHIYQAWKEAPKVPVELNAGNVIVPLYSGKELVNHYEDLRDNALSGRASQSLSKKLGLAGPKGEPRTAGINRDDTLDMMELPLTAVKYDTYNPQTFEKEDFGFKTYLYVWPVPEEDARGHSVYGFTFTSKRPEKL